VGVDLTRVKATGPGGRITREDVLAVVRQQSQAAAQAAEPTLRDAWGPIRIERMSKIRRTIAEKMHQSWTTCPRVTNFDDADVTELERLRQASKDDYSKKGIKLTSLPFVVKAVASALKQHPALNASIDMEQGQIIYKEYVNIGIAVDTERGLVVPVLRRADELSIPELARALAELSERVRQGQFTPEDLQGSTFSISNLGAIGGTYSTPIINIPEVAILLVGRSRKMPVVVGDQVAIRLMMPLSLSYDHRLVDGATAARFLNEVIGYLEAPSRLLLAP
jgi:pyruvate/2-oxoglutarate dehydrogenase complex dihydrolipoamide acyltransferase (E2) component